MSKQFCPKHPNQALIQLFTSWACDVCDGKAELKATPVYPNSSERHQVRRVVQGRPTTPGGRTGDRRSPPGRFKA